MARFADTFFPLKFGITERDLERYLSAGAHSCQAGDYADLYFEYLTTSSIAIDESIVKSASQGVTLGVGIRVISGERTGYAYSDDLSPEQILKAARTAACIASGPAQVEKTGLESGAPKRNLYPVLTPPAETPLTERVSLVKRADEAARAADPRVFLVQASYADSLRHILIANSDGVLKFDRQTMTRLNVLAKAKEPTGIPQQGYSGGGGRVGLEFFVDNHSPEAFAKEAVRQAIVQLDAVDTPAGETVVVLGPGLAGGCCCTKPSGTGSKRTSIARRSRRFPIVLGSRWRVRCVR